MNQPDNPKNNESSSNGQSAGPEFIEATRTVDAVAAESDVADALAKWYASTQENARQIEAVLAKEFPDDYAPEEYWSGATHHDFRGFFSWGHDHEFGWGVTRKGAMKLRHTEIIAECIGYGLLPQTIEGRDLLNVGCWSGGDILALSGLGAKVTAIEEHPRSAASARRLCELLGCPTEVIVDSVYNDRRNWQGRFDIVYASGVIYHVTDPLLFARILFAYLRPGGTVVLETKASADHESSCTYSGTLEPGWNWYAPTRGAFGRWLVDAGFKSEDIQIRVRDNGRLLASATKRSPCRLPETAGFSRPGSWLETEV
jgi:2-polyprenyl-3-methyl-5-hydroxy-6-metoxy-1,4-benzoquinol methylase